MPCCKKIKTTTKKKTTARQMNGQTVGQVSVTSREDMGKEFKTLAKNLKENLVAAWNSEQRKKAQKGVDKGFEMMVKGISTVIKEAKKGTLDDKIKKGVHKVLKEANTKLEKSKRVWKPVGKK